MRQAPSPPAALTVPQTPLDHPSLPRYPAYGGFFAGIYLIYHCKPLEALDIKYWARPRAQKELEQDMRMMDKLNKRPDLQRRLSSVAKNLNMIEEEMYDLIFIRNEYKMLMGMHNGRVPAELKEIFEELAAH